MSEPTIVVTFDRDVATVALNRPEVHNAFNAQLIGELTDTFGSLSSESGVRVVVLRGMGKSFCAGADVNWMHQSLELSEEQNMQDALRMSDMFAAINDAPQAVIARVHGACLGGGMGIIAVSDIVVAAENARFGFTEARLGIIPAVISRFVVPKIGSSWARRLFLTAERFEAATALQIGIIHNIVAEAELDPAIDRHIKALRASGPQAVHEGKALIADLIGRAPSEHRTFTAQRIAAVRTSPEGQEGLRAFLEKRPPSWADTDA